VRFTVAKGKNPWDAGANMAINKPLQKGDVLLIAFWARVVTPGRDTGTLANASVTGGSGETITITSKWEMYYLSGVADADYKPGKANVGMQLAAEEQTVELGPVFVIDFGPNYDMSRLPHNKAAPPVTQTVTPTAQSPYASELAAVQAKLPVKGALLNDPGTLYTWGPDLSSTQISVPDIADGKVNHVVIAKAGAQPWDDGATVPVSGAIKKGDVVVIAMYVRATGANGGTISNLGLGTSGPTGTTIAAKPVVLLLKNAWTWVYASGVAARDCAPGTVALGMQLGATAQTLDFGPAFVLDLGPGVDPSKLPG
jgi:hypothetical protein